MSPLPTGTNWSSNFVGVAPEMRFRFEAVKQGTHYIHIRTNAPNSGSDSVHYGIDGNPVNTFFFPQSSTLWQWNFGTRTFNIPAVGEYELTLWAREAGLRLDRIVVTVDPNWNLPADLSDPGPPESPFSGGGGSAACVRLTAAKKARA